MRFLLGLLLLSTVGQCQWSIQRSPSTADLRGIHSLGKGVAWASGTKGTVLRTVDGGASWTPCPVPSGAEKLDFRAVQGFNRERALVMSAGPGDLSRLYKTSDGCKTWKLVFANPDQTGFWDGLRFDGPRKGVLIGDSVNGRFPVFLSADSGDTWKRFESFPITPGSASESLFAASNTSLLLDQRGTRLRFVTGGGNSSLVSVKLECEKDCVTIASLEGKIAVGSAGAGGFSVAAQGDLLVVVGGDYKKPDQREGTAATWISGVWRAAESLPGGYRSSVVFDQKAKRWIAAGPNGTDVSMDDGMHWRAWTPDTAEEKDADKNWNAISLPFAVGPKGRIGKLREGAH